MGTKAKGLFRFDASISKFLLLSLLAAGCSAERVPPSAKPVVPVSGLVVVDGAPVAGVQVRFNAVKQDPQNATLSIAKTNAEGKFKAFTYRMDDGVPPGDYTLTFNDQSQANPGVRNPPDLFKGKYADAATSEFKLTVPADGKPIDMGKIELTR